MQETAPLLGLTSLLGIWLSPHVNVQYVSKAEFAFVRLTLANKQIDGVREMAQPQPDSSNDLFNWLDHFACASGAILKDLKLFHPIDCNVTVRHRL